MAGKRLGYPGIVLVVTGAVSVLISFTSVNWYAGSNGADAISDIGFRDLHENLSAFHAPAAATTYFGAIAWILLILAILFGFGANLPTSGSNTLRVAGLAVGLAGFAWTYYALAQYIQALKDRGVQAGVFRGAEAGIYLALAGYVLLAVGAALGPMSRKVAAAPATEEAPRRPRPGPR